MPSHQLLGGTNDSFTVASRSTRAMAPEKKNEFLDASDSEEDQLDGYGSDDDIKKGGRSVKRRKTSDDSGDDDEASDLEQEIDAEDDDREPIGEDALAESQVEKGKAKARKLKLATEVPDITRTLTKKNLVATEAAIKKSGVVYLSRIPPFMKPAKLRNLLEPYGTINRIFLAPEDPTAHARRVRGGGNKKRSYTEGWVEFVQKKDAKEVCELLNARTIGGKKGSYYHDDMWNLLYLKGFKWHNLTEQIAAEDAERSSRMRAEISKTTKENKNFVRNVERAKMLDGMQAKAKKRKAPDEEVKEGGRDRTRTFKQVPLAKKGQATDEQPADVTRVLSKIF